MLFVGCDKDFSTHVGGDGQADRFGDNQQGELSSRGAPRTFDEKGNVVNKGGRGTTTDCKQEEDDGVKADCP